MLSHANHNSITDDDKAKQNQGSGMIQARKNIARLMAQAGPKDLLVMVGLGSGRHAKAVLEYQNGPRLTVYDPKPDPGKLDPALAEGLARLEVCQDLNQLAEVIASQSVYGPQGRVAVFMAPGKDQSMAEPLQAVRKLVGDVMGRAKVDSQTRRQKNMLWAQYVADNAAAVMASPEVTGWRGVLAGVPALIIGAGPSLTDSLEHIAEYRDKMLLMGAASILGPLGKAGITPHCVTALEAKDESRQFVGLNMDEVLLAAASNSHPNHFKQWPGMIGHFHLIPWVAQVFGGMALPNGGHATSAAFTLALMWGCDPIILVGQDLAYSGGRVHAQGRIGGEDDGVHQQVEVTAIGGGTVMTSPVFFSYIGWYQESAGYLARSGNPTKVINSTTQGALIPGMIHMPLEQVINQCPDVTIGHQDMNNICRRSPKPMPKTVSMGLLAASKQVSQAIKAGTLAAMRGAQPGSAVAYAAEGLEPEELTHQLPDRFEQILEAINAIKGAING